MMCVIYLCLCSAGASIPESAGMRKGKAHRVTSSKSAIIRRSRINVTLMMSLRMLVRCVQVSYLSWFIICFAYFYL